VQVHVPQGVGVRVPPWAPSTWLLSRSAKRRILAKGWRRFCFSGRAEPKHAKKDSFSILESL
ncbi:MAG: hypothetical protein V4582_25600, partial [Pseudomonadota bacterium]